ncbi:MAG: hypothetical protein JWO13_1645 [Acidobacteriales bacterium]|nr:hypothetical protein [Terriglobales bacterium]
MRGGIEQMAEIARPRISVEAERERAVFRPRKNFRFLFAFSGKPCYAAFRLRTDVWIS